MVLILFVITLFLCKGSDCMIIKYPNTPVPTVEIKAENDDIKMGFTNENRKLFVQVITSHSQDGTNVGQAACILDKEELEEYINVLKGMHELMQEKDKTGSVKKVPKECYELFGSDLDGCSTQENEGCGRCPLYK